MSEDERYVVIEHKATGVKFQHWLMDYNSMGAMGDDAKKPFSECFKMFRLAIVWFDYLIMRLINDG
jgi:hypothetical protein